MDIKIKDLVWQIFLDSPGECFPCGYTNRFACEIHLNSELNDNLLKRTIKHEITHALIWSYGLYSPYNKKFTEEEVCNFIETHIDEIKELSDYVYGNLNKKDTKNKKGKVKLYE